MEQLFGPFYYSSLTLLIVKGKSKLYLSECNNGQCLNIHIFHLPCVIFHLSCLLNIFLKICDNGEQGVKKGSDYLA